MNPVEEFLALKKEASWWSDFAKNLVGLGKGQPGTAATAAQIMQPVLGTALVYGTGTAMYKGYGAIKEKFDKAKNFQAMVQANPTLQKQDASQVQALYNSLHRLSPTMAKDPLLAGSFVRTMISRGTEGGLAVPFDTAKTLAETERNIAQSGGRHALLDAIGSSVGRIQPPQAMQERYDVPKDKDKNPLPGEAPVLSGYTRTKFPGEGR